MNHTAPWSGNPSFPRECARAGGNFRNRSNIINLAVPLNQPVTTSLSEIKALIVARQRGRLKSLGIDPDGVKSTKAPPCQQR